MAVHHAVYSSPFSETSLTKTVSSLQRCVFGNIFRSQRQLLRFAIGLAVLLLFMYLLSSIGSQERVTADVKSFAINQQMTEGLKSVSEYHATFFEEMGKHFSRQNFAKMPDFFYQNSGKLPVPDSQAELTEVAEKVREVALTISRCHSVPGLSVVMVSGSASFKIPLGFADISSNRSVTTETIFLLNSLSKTFLGQLLAVLLSDSSTNFTWDTRVADILGPDFQLVTKELTREITLRDLLSHRSGLSSGNLAVRATYPDGWTRTDVIRGTGLQCLSYILAMLTMLTASHSSTYSRIAPNRTNHLRDLPQSAPFRKTFLYSNMGALLLTHVTEKIGGASWEKLIVDKLLKPLGMFNSQPITSYKELEMEEFSKLYVPVEGTIKQADTRIFNQGPLNAVALLSTTSSDMARWLQFNLRQGKLLDGQQLIDHNIWSDMWKKHVELSPMFLAGIDKSSSRWPVQDTSEGYGLFWFINKYRGLKNFWHGGGLYTHYTLAWHFPEKDVALYVVINGYSGSSKPFSVVESLAYYAADLLLGYQPWLNKSSVCAYPKPWVFAGPDSSGNPSEKIRSGNGRIQQESVGIKTDIENSQRDVFTSALGIFNMQTGFGSKLLKFSDTAELKQTAVADYNNFDSNHQPLEQIIVNASAFSARDNLLQTNRKEDAGEIIRQLNVSLAPKFPLGKYQGLYYLPLFGNFSVSLDETRMKLKCQMNILTGMLHLIKIHTFGVELTGSLQFLSKPSLKVPAKNCFEVTFVESNQGEITAVDIFSSWPMEVPIRFQRIR